MQGIGNDFVMVDALRETPLPTDLPAFARMVCDRRFGIGGDGLILLEKGDEAPFRQRMFNPDGSESEMCGNGIRCFARLLVDHGHASDDAPIPVETGAGLLHVEVLPDRRVRVDMGIARLRRGQIGMTGEATQAFVEQEVGHGYRGTAVSMGNPHLTIFVDDVEKVDLETVGPSLERHPFFPQRTNVHFVQVIDRTHLIQRTWERGAGITLACGTGACASVVAAVITDRSERKVENRLPGGVLEIEVAPEGRVLMTGPAETVFDGVVGSSGL
jgi:diaminopimelate epimerase